MSRVGRALGKVYLVGAGPGDPGLMTVRGRELLGRADVVVYDYLIGDELLALAPPGAELVYVGKRGFSRHVDQDEINALLVRLATDREAGPRMIVRLKGGDPFVFGRGGEEALALSAAGVPFEVVPGVTSGIAAPVYAGIPVTHRKLSSSVTLVTGREDPTRDETGVDWAGLASLAARGGTLCFYMGVRSLPVIVRRLMEEGLDADTPAAAVRWGTTPEQESLVATLSTVARRAREARFAAPAIILVGRTVTLREGLAWYERLPLFGRTIVCTRAAGQANQLGALLGELGARVLSVPTIAFAPPEDYGPLDAAIGQLARYDWVVFTSANGVARFFERLRGRHGGDDRALGHARVAAIGPSTAARLGEEGISPDVVPGSYRAEAVYEAMRAFEARCGDGTEGGLRGRRVLIPRARVAREALPELLRSAGAEVDVAPAYRTVVPEGDTAGRLREALGRADGVTFTSSSTVRNLVALLGGEAPVLLGSLDVFSIGPVTSETLRRAGLPPSAEAQTYTVPGLVEAIRAHYAHHEAGT